MKVKYVIGGHGDVVGKKGIDFTYNYLTKLKKQVQKLMDDGEDIADVVNAVKMPEYKDVPFYDSIHRQNVEHVYRTLEWESE